MKSNNKVLWLGLGVFSLVFALTLSAYAKQGPENGKLGLGNGTSTQAQNRFMASTSTSTPGNQGRGMASTSTSTPREWSKADEHRSEVAKFVKSLNEISDRHWGIGEQVREIAREQASSTDETANAIKKIEGRNGFKTFLIGSDYKNLGQIRSDIVKTQNRIEKLNKELEKMASSTDKTTILADIKTLEDHQAKIETFVKANESRFSLFGWFMRIFNR